MAISYSIRGWSRFSICLCAEYICDRSSNSSMIFSLFGCFQVLSSLELSLRPFRYVLRTPTRSKRCALKSNPYFSPKRSWQQQSSRLFLGSPTSFAASCRLTFLGLLRERCSQRHRFTISTTSKMTLYLLRSRLIDDDTDAISTRSCEAIELVLHADSASPRILTRNMPPSAPLMNSSGTWQRSELTGRQACLEKWQTLTWRRFSSPTSERSVCATSTCEMSDEKSTCPRYMRSQSSSSTTRLRRNIY